MEFSELKMIWDSQNEEPLYAMNEAALHGVVRRRNEETNRCISRCYLVEIATGAACGALMLVCAGVLVFGSPAWLATFSWIRVAVSRWDSLGLLVAGGVWFYYCAYMYLARKRQLQREELFAATLRGDIDRALAQTEFQVATARSIVWWGLIPVWVATALWVLILLHLSAKPGWTYLLMGVIMLGALAFVVSGKQRAITNRYQPRRRELEALRLKLVDPER
jgi:hypothetical protein